jgi:hypothetical protein
MTAAELAALIPALVGLILAITAWVRSEVANRNAGKATSTANNANLVAASANARSRMVATQVGRPTIVANSDANPIVDPAQPDPHTD